MPSSHHKNEQLFDGAAQKPVSVSPEARAPEAVLASTLSKILVTETFVDDQSYAITSAIAAYFDLMYDADDDRFPKVFHDAALIHGLRDGKLVAWSASDFRNIMRGRSSPAATNSPRDQEIISTDRIAPGLVTAKVRVRIGQTCFIDHLTFHRIDGEWLVTSKAFHVAQVFPPGS